MPITKASSNAVAPAAKGDLVVGNATNDSGILAVGSANQVLTVDSSTATGLKWATASAGGMTLLSTTNLSGTATDVTGIATGYVKLIGYIQGITLSGSASNIGLTNTSNAGCSYAGVESNNSTAAVVGSSSSYLQTFRTVATNTPDDHIICFEIENYSAAVSTTSYAVRFWGRSGSDITFNYGGAFSSGTGPWTSLRIRSSSGTFTAGTLKLYGVK